MAHILRCNNLVGLAFTILLAYLIKDAIQCRSAILLYWLHKCSWNSLNNLLNC